MGNTVGNCDGDADQLTRRAEFGQIGPSSGSARYCGFPAKAAMA